MFIVDSNDHDRIDVVRDRLHNCMRNEELLERNSCFLIFANKQDMPGAMTVVEITEKLDLHNLHFHSIRGIKWKIQGCSAIFGDGLLEGLDWIC